MNKKILFTGLAMLLAVTSSYATSVLVSRGTVEQDPSVIACCTQTKQYGWPAVSREVRVAGDKVIGSSHIPSGHALNIALFTIVYAFIVCCVSAVIRMCGK